MRKRTPSSIRRVAMLLCVGGYLFTAAPKTNAQTPPPQTTVGPVSHFDESIFLKPLPAEQLKAFKQFNGASASSLIHDKQFRKVIHSIVPNCMFHYGRDMPLEDALMMVFEKSREPVILRQDRYLVASGLGGPYLAGRGFLWLDLQDGIGAGGFFFRPTNGEPTPSLAVFSRQVKQDALGMNDLPPEFLEELGQWSQVSSVPPLETTYFLTGSNRRILLEHDGDYCAEGIAPGECEQMNADAADLDLTAAYYLDQVHHATNATAWMMGPQQTEFLQVREHTCGGLVDPLPCRVRVTRERVAIIVRRQPHR